MVYLAIGLLSGLSIIIILNLLNRKTRSLTSHHRSIAHYVGRVFTLQFPVINGTGIVQTDQTTLRIHCLDLPAGSRIKIVGIDGMVLLAEPNQG